jgi:hypothetical protein
MSTQVDLEQTTSRNYNTKTAGTSRNLKYFQNYTST